MDLSTAFKTLGVYTARFSYSVERTGGSVLREIIRKMGINRLRFAAQKVPAHDAQEPFLMPVLFHTADAFMRMEFHTAGRLIQSEIRVRITQPRSILSSTVSLIIPLISSAFRRVLLRVKIELLGLLALFRTGVRRTMNHSQGRSGVHLKRGYPHSLHCSL